MDCIFCKIINKEIPSKIVYEDEQCLAFLDITQTTKGHTLVVPKKHFSNFLEVDSDTLQHMIQITQNIAKKLVKRLDAKGCNILTNANTVAGQTVMHFHIHIIPRFDETDTITLSFSDNSENFDLSEIYQSILD
jgi:histidine triad (HIT) family protein